MLLDKFENAALWAAGLFQKSIGIYRTDNFVYAVELQKRINEYRETNKNIYDLNRNTFPEIIDQINSDFNLKDKFVVTNLQNPGASFKVIKISLIQEEEIESWLKENFNQFINIPIPLEQTVLTYKIIKKNEDIILFIGIVNREEIDELISIFEKNNIIISSLSSGLSDLFLTETRQDDFFCTYALKNNNHEVIVHRDHRLIFYGQIPAAFSNVNDKDEDLLGLAQKIFSESFKILEYEPDADRINWIDFKKDANDDIHFLPAEALAKKAFYPEENTLNFIPSEKSDKSQEFIWKQAFFKTTISLGSVMLLFYLISFVINFFFNMLHDNVLAELDALAPKTALVKKLEHNNNILKKDLLETKKMKSYRSQSYLILEAAAFHIPKDCWLTGIFYDKKSDKPLNTTLKGMSKTRTTINEFLGKLEEDANLKNVKLDFINKIPRDKLYRNWKIKSSQYFEFQISFDY